MSNRIEYKYGQKVGHCIFIKDLPSVNKVRRKAVFICPKCNQQYSANVNQVVSGGSSSCGCERMANMVKAVIKHGATSNYSHSKEYSAWDNMKRRCHNKHHIEYKNYGARGITVCDKWMNDFSTFIEDMGVAPSKHHSLERKNNNKGYYKRNCKWATKQEQLMNRRNTKLYTFNGETKHINAWAEQLGFKKITLWHRINTYKMPIEKALTIPVRAHTRQITKDESINSQHNLFEV